MNGISWRTSLLGVLFGAANTLGGYYANGGHITWATAGASLFGALLGFAAKDSNVTGAGTTAQTK